MRKFVAADVDSLNLSYILAPVSSGGASLTGSGYQQGDLTAENPLEVIRSAPCNAVRWLADNTEHADRSVSYQFCMEFEPEGCYFGCYISDSNTKEVLKEVFRILVTARTGQSAGFGRPLEIMGWEVIKRTCEEVWRVINATA